MPKRCDSCYQKHLASKRRKRKWEFDTGDFGSEYPVIRESVKFTVIRNIEIGEVEQNGGADDQLTDAAEKKA